MQFYFTQFSDRDTGLIDNLWYLSDSGVRICLKLSDSSVTLIFCGEEQTLVIQPFLHGIVIEFCSSDMVDSTESTVYYAESEPQALHLPEMNGIAQKFITWVCGGGRNGERILRQFKVSGDTVYLRARP